MTKMPATVTTAGLPKPAKACSTVTRPVRASAAATMTATRSARSFSVANRIRAPKVMTAKTNNCKGAVPSVGSEAPSRPSRTGAGA